MSVLGTGVAASVAPASLAGQQAAQQRDRRSRDVRDNQKRVGEVFSQHIRALEENETDDSSEARLAVDTQAGSDHEDPGEDTLCADIPTDLESLPETIDPATAIDLSAAVTSRPAPAQAYTSSMEGVNEHPLYRHVDFQA